MSAKDKLPNLVKHLENNKNKLSGGIIPSRYVGKEVAYREFLEREIRRTSKKVEELKLSGK
jgi:hypothetical protein